MSFNNQLNFNVSKSSPTISTTNATSISGTSSSGGGSLESSNSGTINSKAPFFNSMLNKSSATMSSSLPKADSAKIVINDTSKEAHNQNNSDLIGLFDKFDIGSKDTISSEEANDIQKSNTINSINEDKLSIISKGKDEDEEEKSEDKDTDSESFSNPPVNEKETRNTIPEEINKRQDKEDQQEEENQELLEVTPLQGQSTSHPCQKENFDGEKEDAEVSSKKDEKDSSKQTDLLDLTDDFSTQTSPIEEYDPPKEDVTPLPLIERPPRNQTRTNSQRGPITEITRKTQAVVKPEEQYQQSHKPFDFQNFLGQLRKKSADPIVRYIRSFLVSFIKQVNNSSAEQKIKVISDFKSFMNEKFLLYEPFASMDAIDLENSREGLEKLIMNRLYDQCFPSEIEKKGNSLISDTFRNDLKNDREFALNLEKYSWINGTHLDIDLEYLTDVNKDNKTFTEYAITELNKINNYRAPRDKIICILNSCKIIFSFLKLNRQETNADSFIPLLIIVIIKAKTANIISNIHYIENFRGQEWLSHGETCYYLSSIEGAIEFIKNLSFEDLTINEEEYKAHIEAWDAERARRITEEAERKLKLAEPVPILSDVLDPINISHPQSLSPSNVLMTSAEMFTKSISQFLSPSPAEVNSAEIQQNNHNQRSEEENATMKDSYKKMREIFPDLDKVILKDIITMNKGNIDQCLEACLQLTNEV